MTSLTFATQYRLRLLRGTFPPSAIVLLLAIGQPGHAETLFTGEAGLRGQSESNVFGIEDESFAPGTTDLQKYDFVTAATAMASVEQRWRHQRLHISGNASRYRYGHFNQLNRTEYNVGLGLDSNLGSAWTVGASISRGRTLETLSDLGEASISARRDTNADGQLGFQINDRWMLEAGISHDQMVQPTLGALVLRQKETREFFRATYGAQRRWGASVEFSTLDGRYGGTYYSTNPTYNEDAGGLTVRFSPSPRTSVDAGAGYVSRKSDALEGDLSEPTFQLNINHQLTAKTRAQLFATRATQSYVIAADTQLVERATALIEWQATRKLSVTLSGWMAWTTFSEATSAFGTARKDREHNASIGLAYQPARWLTLTPFFQMQSRNSNALQMDYDANVLGINFSVRKTR